MADADEIQSLDIADLVEAVREELSTLFDDPKDKDVQDKLDFFFTEAIESMARQEDTMGQVDMLVSMKAEALLVVSGSALQPAVTQRLEAVFDAAIRALGVEAGMEERVAEEAEADANTVTNGNQGDAEATS